MGCLLDTSFSYCEPYSAGGIRRILMTNSSNLIDYYFSITGDTEYSLINSLNISFGTVFYEFNFDKTQTSFVEEMDKSGNGKLFTKRLETIFTRMSYDKRSVINKLLNSKLVILIMDYNNNWWIMGEDNPVKAVDYQATTSNTEGTNEYRVTFQTNGKYPIRRINALYVDLNLTISGGPISEPTDNENEQA